MRLAQGGEAMGSPIFWCLVAVSLAAFGLAFLVLMSPSARRAFFKAPTFVRS